VAAATRRADPRRGGPAAFLGRGVPYRRARLRGADPRRRRRGLRVRGGHTAEAAGRSARHRAPHPGEHALRRLHHQPRREVAAGHSISSHPDRVPRLACWCSGAEDGSLPNFLRCGAGRTHSRSTCSRCRRGPGRGSSGIRSATSSPISMSSAARQTSGWFLRTSEILLSWGTAITA
jgi:hypothetical protein